MQRDDNVETQARIANLPPQQFENEAQVRTAWLHMTSNSERSDEAER